MRYVRCSMCDVKKKPGQAEDGMAGLGLHRTSHIEQGFTLVELLVVVSIIALLLAILLPSLSKARLAAKQIQCLSILKQYGIANELYADANQNWYVPLVDKIDYADPNAIWSVNPSFFAMLGVIKSTPPGSMVPRRVTCPLASFALQSPAPTLDAYNLIYCYGYNGSFAGSGFSSTAAYVAYKRSQIVSPSNKLSLSDAVRWWTDWYSSDLYVGETSTANAAYRHQDSINSVFFDSHAGNLPRMKVDKTYLTWTEITAIWCPTSP